MAGNKIKKYDADKVLNFVINFCGNENKMHKFQKRIKFFKRISIVSLLIGALAGIYNLALTGIIVFFTNTICLPALYSLTDKRKELFNSICSSDLTYKDFLNLYNEGHIDKIINYLKEPTKENYILTFDKKYFYKNKIDYTSLSSTQKSYLSISYNKFSHKKHLSMQNVSFYNNKILEK